MTRKNQTVEYVFALLAAIAVFIALNGIAYRSILYPQLNTTTAANGAGLSYTAVCSRPAQFSDAQFDAYVRRFRGQPVTNWQGWIRWQSSQNSELQTVGLAADLPGDLTWGRDFELIGVPAATAESLRWGQQVTFSGTIRYVKIWGDICQPIVEDVVFAP